MRKFDPEKRSRACKDAIHKCPVFGSGNSEEGIMLRAQAISCVSLYVLDVDLRAL